VTRLFDGDWELKKKKKERKVYALSRPPGTATLNSEASIYSLGQASQSPRCRWVWTLEKVKSRKAEENGGATKHSLVMSERFRDRNAKPPADPLTVSHSPCLQQESTPFSRWASKATKKGLELAVSVCHFVIDPDELGLRLFVFLPFPTMAHSLSDIKPLRRTPVCSGPWYPFRHHSPSNNNTLPLAATVTAYLHSTPHIQ
jgi:hypothetical protein